MTEAKKVGTILANSHINLSVEGISTKMRAYRREPEEAVNRYRATLENGPGGIVFEQR